MTKKTPTTPHPEDLGVRTAKRLLIEAAENPADGEWREGYIAALQAVLLAYGIGAWFVPATYRFEPPPETEETGKVE